MDLGLAFEDEDLLCDEKDRTGDRHLPYNVKICSKEWFEQALQDKKFDENSKDYGSEEHLKMEKFSADLHYHKKYYVKASGKYKRLLDIMSSKIGSALWLDIQESLCRCYLHTGRTDDGVSIARDLVKKAMKEDEVKQRQAFILLSFAYEKAEKWGDCVFALEQLCELNPLFPQSWNKLGDAYQHILDKQALSTAEADILRVKQLSSYTRASIIFRSVMGLASDFIKNRNAAFIQQLDIKIDQVPISQSRKSFASEFIRNETEKQASFNKVDSPPDNDQVQAISDRPVKASFYEKFCSWNIHCES